MNDHQVATATVQNSAYRHRNYEGRFRKRRRPSLFSGYRWRELRFLVKEWQDFFHQRVGCDAARQREPLKFRIDSEQPKRRNSPNEDLEPAETLFAWGAFPFFRPSTGTANRQAGGKLL